MIAVAPNKVTRKEDRPSSARALNGLQEDDEDDGADYVQGNAEVTADYMIRLRELLIYALQVSSQDKVESLLMHVICFLSELFA